MLGILPSQGYGRWTSRSLDHPQALAVQGLLRICLTHEPFLVGAVFCLCVL